MENHVIMKINKWSRGEQYDLESNRHYMYFFLCYILIEAFIKKKYKLEKKKKI